MVLSFPRLRWGKHREHRQGNVLQMQAWRIMYYVTSFMDEIRTYACSAMLSWMRNLSGNRTVRDGLLGLLTLETLPLLLQQHWKSALSKGTLL